MGRLHFVFSLAFASLSSWSVVQAPGDDKSAAAKANDRAEKPSLVQLTDEARRIHREALVIDGHNDLPYRYRQAGDLVLRTIDIAKPQPTLHTDIPRLRQGGVGAQFVL